MKFQFNKVAGTYITEAFLRRHHIVRHPLYFLYKLLPSHDDEPLVWQGNLKVIAFMLSQTSGTELVKGFVQSYLIVPLL